MKYTRAQVAKHLGVDVDGLMDVVERGDQVVVILTDYRKIAFPVSSLTAEETVKPAGVTKK